MRGGGGSLQDWARLELKKGNSFINFRGKNLVESSKKGGKRLIKRYLSLCQVFWQEPGILFLLVGANKMILGDWEKGRVSERREEEPRKKELHVLNQCLYAGQPCLSSSGSRHEMSIFPVSIVCKTNAQLLTSSSKSKRSMRHGAVCTSSY